MMLDVAVPELRTYYPLTTIHHPAIVLASVPSSWHHLSATRNHIHEDRIRMAKQAVATRTDLDPIDRLEEKVRMLVGIVTQLRADHARATEENGRLARELDGLRARLAESEEVTGSELSALREERELVRSRVAEMLEQLEAI
jgi:regulator of replication initiation timing